MSIREEIPTSNNFFNIASFLLQVTGLGTPNFIELQKLLG